MSGIILFAILIAISIAQAVIKAKRTKQEQQKTAGTGNQPSLEEAWHGLGETPAETKDSPYVFSGMESSKETEAVRKYEQRAKSGRTPAAATTRSAREKAAIHPSLSSVGESGTMAVEELDEPGGFIEEFDIEKAIIYSEIMAPKFREG